MLLFSLKARRLKFCVLYHWVLVSLLLLNKFLVKMTGMLLGMEMSAKESLRFIFMLIGEMEDISSHMISREVILI